MDGRSSKKDRFHLTDVELATRLEIGLKTHKPSDLALSASQIRRVAHMLRYHDQLANILEEMLSMVGNDDPEPRCFFEARKLLAEIDREGA